MNGTLHAPFSLFQDFKYIIHHGVHTLLCTCQGGKLYLSRSKTFRTILTHPASNVNNRTRPHAKILSARSLKRLQACRQIVPSRRLPERLLPKSSRPEWVSCFPCTA